MRAVSIFFVLLSLFSCGKHETIIPDYSNQGGGKFLDRSLDEEMVVAAQGGNIEFIKSQLEASFDINKVLKEGKTLLIIAVEWKKYDLVEYLMTKTPDLMIKDEEGNIALDYAGDDSKMRAILGEAPTQEELDIKLFAIIDQDPGNDRAQQRQQIIELKKVIEQGANLNHLNEKGITPLIFAIIKKNEKVAIEIIRTRKANLRQKDKRGKDALFWAKRRKLARIQKLIERELRRSP